MEYASLHDTTELLIGYPPRSGSVMLRNSVPQATGCLVPAQSSSRSSLRFPRPGYPEKKPRPRCRLLPAGPAGQLVGHCLGRNLDIAVLIFSSQGLSPAKQGITSQGNYNAHRLPTRSDVHYGFMYPFDFQADRKRWSLLLQSP